MTMEKILVSCPLIQDTIQEYESQFAKYEYSIDAPEVDQHLSEDELLNIIDQYVGVIAGDDEFTARVLQSANNLRVISKWGIGTDNIDKSAAEQEGIEVYNTPGMFDEEVADVVIGYSIMLTRQLHQIDKQVRQGIWYCPRGMSLADKTCGVVGVGNIGSEVVRRATAMGMNVVGTDVQTIPVTLIDETGIEQVELEELLVRSDVVSLNCPLTDSTENLIGFEELKRIGTEGYLINTSRGGLINQPELVTALENDIISGAALDVFEDEPLSEDHSLTELDNVILGSHNAQNTQEAVRRTNNQAVENLLRGLGVSDPTVS